jgi:hypothetical protein
VASEIATRTFVIQVPNKPFGLAWYQGDMETNGSGRGSQDYVGRFNIETFAVAVGSVKAPRVPGVGRHNRTHK